MKSTLIGRALGAALLAGTVSTWLAASPAHANTFTHLPGAAMDIAQAPNDSLWVVGTDSAGSAGNHIHHWNVSTHQWDLVPGAAQKIAVDRNDNPYIINNFNQIFRWNGSGWTQLPGAATDIAIDTMPGGGSIWVIGTDSAGPAGNHIYQGNGSSWTQVPGGAVHIAVRGTGGSIGQPWVVNAYGQLFWGIHTPGPNYTFSFVQTTGAANPTAERPLAGEPGGTICVIGSDQNVYCKTWTSDSFVEQTSPSSANPTALAVFSAGAVSEVTVDHAIYEAY